MVAQRPYIIYTLPISRVSQALIGGKIEKVWSNIEAFLTTCTSVDIESPRSVYLVGYTADECNGEEPEKANVLIEKVNSVFGNGETSPVGSLYPANIP